MTIHKLSDPLTHSYLDGSRFDETITFGYDFLTPLRNRVEVLSELVAGKRILHIGCCDHIPLLQRKLGDRTWLHGRLTEAAAYCIGIDIDAEAISEARSLSGLRNIFYGDVTVMPKIAEIGNDKFDYTLLGEVMEHIGNPVHFLKSLLSIYRENIEQVIITVPNALRADNILNALKARETNNSDHRFFFTPYTIAKVAWDAGLAPVSVQMALYSPAGRLKRAILNRFPLLGENLIYIGASRSSEHPRAH
ncbi:MAG TPA: methyltransferase domain-containing protein [Chthoniobacterales bacterium]|jgi:SAM-dependent methyltransferase|nr:methyltransferase domain-containing protein [Chthoniobacterales bacterium]